MDTLAIFITDCVDVELEWTEYPSLCVWAGMNEALIC